jgi:long-subunit fatty acid transport protein
VPFATDRLTTDSNNPVSVTTSQDFKDTRHVAAGAQYKWSDAWTLNLAVAYDSAFQDNDSIALALPANSVWRFGIGGQREESKTFSWGWSGAYAYGCNLHANVSGGVPVAMGGRGDVVGSFNNAGVIFIAANFNWKF